MRPDPNSPAAGEAGEQKFLNLHVDGCYDIGRVQLKGWTLVANNDLAVYKAQQTLLKAQETDLALVRSYLGAVVAGDCDEGSALSFFRKVLRKWRKKAGTP
jgi:hypothetical protein